MPFLPDNIHLIAAHCANLFVDILVVVNCILLGSSYFNPSEYRIVNLTGMAVIRAVSICRCAWLRGGFRLLCGLRYGGFICWLLAGISKVILCFGRRIRFSLTSLVLGAAVGKTGGCASLILENHCLSIVGRRACCLRTLRGGRREGCIRVGIFLLGIRHIGALCGGGSKIPFRLPCQEVGACKDGYA